MLLATESGRLDRRARRARFGRRTEASLVQALADLHRDMGGEEEQDPFEPSDVGRELFDKELGEGLAERLREELEAVERAERRLGRRYLRPIDSEQQANAPLPAPALPRSPVLDQPRGLQRARLGTR